MTKAIKTVKRSMDFDSIVEEPNEEECLLDEITGRKRKPVMSLLNKTKLCGHEMDELFVGEGVKVEEAEFD